MLPSPKGSSCYICVGESPLIPQMLSELAFDKEHQVVEVKCPSSPTAAMRTTIDTTSKELNDTNATSQYGSSILSSWSGLFCFSFDDPEMFYDAEEIHLRFDEDGRHILTAEELALLKQLRGGGAAAGYDENYVPTPNNLKSRTSNRPITTRDIQSSTAASHFSGFSPSSDRSFPTRSDLGHPAMSNGSLKRKQTASTSSLSAMSSAEHFQSNNDHQEQTFGGFLPPPAPQQLPLRFLRAGKGDPIEGQRRYEATLQWRKEHGIDSILLEPHPNFELIKRHYPHYYHLRGKKGEPVFFEQPPKTDLSALKAGGIDLKSLVRHYAMVTEFQWQFLEPNDMARSITVLDLEGMGMRDFVGECVEYVKMCSQFTGQHYPERAGHVIVINVPRWFSMIWNVVKPMVDEVTLQKISIVRGQKEVFDALAAKIPIENIPPEYGGRSMPLGQSPEEKDLRDLMAHNNALARGDYSCGGRHAQCRFCSWGPARSY
ncbi:CRAL-TRIO domain containing protein [Nitzschia inconspicua]|uniref:CRAL-TRIO domain containing protein n=1 Tax=Nitzschia inconspicua TaxID=303405 RepID=A0A9K3LTQ3_9STRA|nr:CRAL-TRIO domain containing protein [Nitzschia inconspicua]